MSVAGIASSNFLNFQNANVPAQQQQFQQTLQQLGQELQTGNLSAAQTTAQNEFAALQQVSPASADPAAPTGTPATPILSNVLQGTAKHGLHGHTPHHLVGADDDSDSTTQDSNPLGQPLPAGSSSSAQQAYSAWQQDLQQVALNSDLLTAQGADWQAVSLSA